MRKSIIAFVDAYSNGVFGNDEEKICDDTINYWMKTLKQENVNFDKEQREYWSNYYLTMCAGNPSLGADYELLKKVSPQAKAMDEYVERIVAVDKAHGIRENFNEILNAEVSMLSLTKEIDNQLNNLVTAYEEDEEKLRREEQFYSIVKAKSGDEALAKKIMRLQDAKRYDPPVDFAKRLSQSITAQGEQEEAVAMSAKKTALKLLRSYIEGAFEDFILEKKDAYPTEIGLVIPEKGTTVGKYTGKNFKWTGKTKDGKNNSELHTSVKAMYETAKNDSIATVVNKKGGLIAGIIGVVALIVGIILAACDIGFGVALIIGGALLGLVGFVKYVKHIKANKVAREAFAKYYDTAKAKACKIIDEALKARARMNDLVVKFESNKNFTKLFEAPVYETSEAEAPAEVENNEEA
jgi:hypothetical protein